MTTHASAYLVTRLDHKGQWEFAAIFRHWFDADQFVKSKVRDHQYFRIELPR